MSEIKGVTWDFDGNQLSIKSALALGYVAGWRGVSLVDAVSVMTAESQRYARAWHHNHEHNDDGSNVVRNDTGEIIVLSTDRGLFQINDKAQGVEDEAFDAKVNARLAYGIYHARGNQFTAWAAYNSGAYLRYRDEVEKVWERKAWLLMVPKWMAA